MATILFQFSMAWDKKAAILFKTDYLKKTKQRTTIVISNAFWILAPSVLSAQVLPFKSVQKACTKSPTLNILHFFLHSNTIWKPNYTLSPEYWALLIITYIDKIDDNVDTFQLFVVSTVDIIVQAGSWIQAAQKFGDRVLKNNCKTLYCILNI